MKRRQSAIIAIAALGLGISTASAQYYQSRGPREGPYFRADVGPAFFPNGTLKEFGGPTGNAMRFNTGVAADAALGYAFNPNVSADFELGIIGSKIDSVPGFVSDNSRLYDVPFLANIMLSLPIPHSNVVPYLGAGVGFAAAVFDTDNFGNGTDFVTGSESDVVPAGQIFAGVRFLLTPRASLGVGYKFFATGDPHFQYPPDNFNVKFKGARANAILFTFDMMF